MQSPSLPELTFVQPHVKQLLLCDHPCKVTNDYVLAECCSSSFLHQPVIDVSVAFQIAICAILIVHLPTSLREICHCKASESARDGWQLTGLLPGLLATPTQFPEIIAGSMLGFDLLWLDPRVFWLLKYDSEGLIHHLCQGTSGPKLLSRIPKLGVLRMWILCLLQQK